MSIGTSTEPTTEQRIAALVEPTRIALHDAAGRYGRHDKRRKELIEAAADITSAEMLLTAALSIADLMLLLEPNRI